MLRAAERRSTRRRIDSRFVPGSWPHLARIRELERRERARHGGRRWLVWRRAGGRDLSNHVDQVDLDRKGIAGKLKLPHGMPRGELSGGNVLVHEKVRRI